jgi:hypothetical protein
MSHRAAWCVGSESESETEEEWHSLEFDVTISLVADKPKTVHRPFAGRSGRRIVEHMQTIRSKKPKLMTFAQWRSRSPWYSQDMGYIAMGKHGRRQRRAVGRPKILNKKGVRLIDRVCIEEGSHYHVPYHDHQALVPSDTLYSISS